MHEIVILKTRVVMTHGAAEELTARADRYRRLAEQLRDELDDTQLLLQTALHELARARKEKEPQLFARRWLQQHRSPDPAGIPRPPRR
jgi:hypothetical protein